jgi:hypothetical protein
MQNKSPFAIASGDGIFTGELLVQKQPEPSYPTQANIVIIHIDFGEEDVIPHNIFLALIIRIIHEFMNRGKVDHNFHHEQVITNITKIMSRYALYRPSSYDFSVK